MQADITKAHGPNWSLQAERLDADLKAVLAFRVRAEQENWEHYLHHLTWDEAIEKLEAGKAVIVQTGYEPFSGDHALLVMPNADGGFDVFDPVLDHPASRDPLATQG